MNGLIINKLAGMGVFVGVRCTIHYATGSPDNAAKVNKDLLKKLNKIILY